MDGSADTITDGRRVTLELAEWVADLKPDAVPDEVLDDASRSFADFLGECLFVGATKPWGQAIAAFCAHDGGGQPEATIIATGERTLASRAALANGTMALGFEFADFGSGSRPYPFAVTAPLALAESRHRSGEDLALAIVIGYEVMGRVFDATFVRGKTIPFTSHRCTAPSPAPLALPGCSSCRPMRRTWPSVSPAPSPVARFRVTKKAPGNAHLTGAWPVSAP